MFDPLMVTQILKLERDPFEPAIKGTSAASYRLVPWFTATYIARAFSVRVVMMSCLSC
jgi:hypothetical protein